MAVPQTIRTAKLGKSELRLVRKDGVFYGLAEGRRCVEGVDPEDVWKRLQHEAGKADPRYFGYAGARARFLKFFPNGFASPGFAGQERDYKVEAKARLDAHAPLERALDEAGLGETVLGVFRATNLLSPFEKTRLQDVLRGPVADPFVRAAAAFAADPTDAALRRLDGILKPHDCAKWTIVTYLPFLWRPEAHMFLKPEVTRDYAVRVGHPFAEIYEARLAPAVYRSLLDLASRTRDEIHDLGPRDMIDIQSFIWTVGA
jgi:hypothetical protein